MLCRVTNIARKRPQGQQLDEANPERSEETGFWVCPFCKKGDFTEISEVGVIVIVSISMQSVHSRCLVSVLSMHCQFMYLLVHACYVGLEPF